MKAFEIHVFQAGNWKIDSIYDDRELAMYQAKRIEASRRLPAIRVIEETFDEATQQTRTRTIFRGSKLEKLSRENLESSIQARRRAQVERRRREAEYRERKRRHRTRRRKSDPYRLAWVFSLLVMSGIAAFVGLQHARSVW